MKPTLRMKATSRTRSSASTQDADNLPAPSFRVPAISNRDSMYSSRDSMSSNSALLSPPSSFSSYRSSSSTAPSRKSGASLSGASLSRTTSTPSTVCPNQALHSHIINSRIYHIWTHVLLKSSICMIGEQSYFATSDVLSSFKLHHSDGKNVMDVIRRVVELPE